MRILVAPDSMKECLSARETAKHIEAGVKKAVPEAEVLIVPMADGGEGTVKALVDSTGGYLVETRAHDPLMREIKTFYGILKDKTTAVIEVAAASGLELLKREERDPMVTTSYGSGELILDAIDRGCKDIIVCLGGSATNDCGAGLVQALGVRLLNEEGEEVHYGGGSLAGIKTIDTTYLDERVYEVKIKVLCDVKNVLLGPQGATYVFGPQKGALPGTLEVLEANMKQFATVLKEQLHKDVAEIPGAGAAGGMGAALIAFLNAELTPGFEAVAQLAGLEEKAQGCSLILTAEGRTDAQSVQGKVPSGIGKMAQRLGIPAIVLTGDRGDDWQKLYETGITAVVPISPGPITYEESLKNAPSLLEDAAEMVCRMLK